MAAKKAAAAKKTAAPKKKAGPVGGKSASKGRQAAQKAAGNRVSKIVKTGARIAKGPQKGQLTQRSQNKAARAARTAGPTKKSKAAGGSKG